MQLRDKVDYSHSSVQGKSNCQGLCSTLTWHLCAEQSEQIIVMDTSSYLAKAVGTHRVTEQRWDETELQEQYETPAESPLQLFDFDTEGPLYLGPGLKEGFSVMRTIPIPDLPCRHFCVLGPDLSPGKGRGQVSLPGGFPNLTLQMLQRGPQTVSPATFPWGHLTVLSLVCTFGQLWPT